VQWLSDNEAIYTSLETVIEAVECPHSSDQ
jgi:hypothetical protein